jgi:hypothetical protein
MEGVGTIAVVYYKEMRVVIPLARCGSVVRYLSKINGMCRDCYLAFRPDNDLFSFIYGQGNIPYIRGPPVSCFKSDIRSGCLCMIFHDTHFNIGDLPCKSQSRASL